MNDSGKTPDARIEETLAALGESRFRAGFHLREKELAYLRAKGIETIREHATEFIRTRIAPANPRNDGRQTPMKNHPVFVAQHATAVCCRGCMEKWHRIPRGRELTDGEIEFLRDLVMTWIERNSQAEGLTGGKHGSGHETP
jgi:hypothetical protein